MRTMIRAELPARGARPAATAPNECQAAGDDAPPASAVVDAASLPVRYTLLLLLLLLDRDRIRLVGILGRRTIRASGKCQEPENKDELACED